MCQIHLRTKVNTNTGLVCWAMTCNCEWDLTLILLSLVKSSKGNIGPENDKSTRSTKSWGEFTKHTRMQCTHCFGVHRRKHGNLATNWTACTQSVLTKRAKQNNPTLAFGFTSRAGAVKVSISARRTMSNKYFIYDKHKKIGASNHRR